MYTIGVITGTYNRFASLKRMIESVRFNIPLGISYIITVVDGGSTDGTLEWLRIQKDVQLIEHGALLGAIRAFTEGAEQTDCEYSVLANDDISFVRGSLMRAIVHLETNPKCGCVAVCDDRPINGMRPEDYHRFKVQTQDARTPDGKHFSAIYAQIAVCRRWIGQEAGWWGYHDEKMSKARTYGGDNFLTSRILEFGYTVDMVAKCNAQDHLTNDTLRQKNNDYHDHAFYERYPEGPIIGSSPIPDRPMPERLRVLYMPIYEANEPLQKINKHGLRDALSKHCLVMEWDYLNEPIHADELMAFAPHIILSQYHDSRWEPLVDELRGLFPSALFINWNGDARGLTDPSYLEMLKKLDLQLVVNASALPIYEREGIPAAYWQIGIEAWQAYPGDVPEYDVLFLGNCYNEARVALGEALRSTGLDVGIYGKKWDNAQGDCLYDFSQGAALYGKCKIAISDAFQDGKTPVEGFVSNRLFQAMAAGAFVLQEYVPSLDPYTELQSNKHYISFFGYEDLVLKIGQYIDNDEKRRKIAKAGQEFVLANYSFDAQVKKLFVDILPKLKSGDTTNEPQLQESQDNRQREAI